MRLAGNFMEEPEAVRSLRERILFTAINLDKDVDEYGHEHVVHIER